MGGNPANNALNTLVHFLAPTVPTPTCRCGLIIAVEAVTYTATIRQTDAVQAGQPALVDHPGVPMDNELAATGTWHYPNVCTNLS